MEAALGREVSQEDYDEVKEELVAEGLLGRGKGKGGSVYLAAADDDEDAGDDFSLAVQEAPEPSEAKPIRCDHEDRLTNGSAMATVAAA